MGPMMDLTSQSNRQDDSVTKPGHRTREAHLNPFSFTTSTISLHAARDGRRAPGPFHIIDNVPAAHCTRAPSSTEPQAGQLPAGEQGGGRAGHGRRLELSVFVEEGKV